MKAGKVTELQGPTLKTSLRDEERSGGQQYGWGQVRNGLCFSHSEAWAPE